MKKTKVSKPNVETAEDAAIRAAIDRVYQKYGTDLHSFFRDVYNELTIKRQDSSEVKNRPRLVASR